MKNPIWMLRSWLGWLNFFLLQWFFVRLQEVGELDDTKQWKHLRWELLTFPVPLSGWWTRYVYLYRGSAARRHTKEPSGHVPRYALLKKHLLRELEAGPRSAHDLDTFMLEDGFRTLKVVHLALEDLVKEGQVRRIREPEGPWQSAYLRYEIVKSE